jgi:ABC-type glycerol-3-phosphate transport system substrate-binding protein
MKMTKKRRFAIILLGGAAIIAGCAIGGTVQLAGTITSATPQPIPGRFQESLGSGQWEIYQLTGTQSGVSAGGVSVNVTHFGPPSLAASMVTITSASGAQVAVQNQSGNSTQTIQKGSAIYTGVASFQVPAAGNYVVSVFNSGAGAVVISRPVLADFVALLPWLAGGLLGAVCLLIGLIGIIVAHRSSPARPGTR